MTPATLRVLITGSRDWACHAVAEQVIARLLARYGPNLVIVHGACDTGVDAAFDAEAQANGIPVEPHPALWGNLTAPGAIIRHRRDGVAYNANAGPFRNEFMVSLGADMCIAVSRDLKSSKGTAGCVRLALAAGIPTWLIDGDDVVPRRITEA